MQKDSFRKRFGPWAIVTGASSGIGREFCEQLAALGINLVLISRRRSALEQTSASLRSVYPIKTRILTLDLSQPSFLPALMEDVSDLDISLVISNAGADHMGALLQISLENLQAMQRLNAASHLDIAHGFGTRFLQTRRRAGFIFLSSMACLQPTPLLANYSGAKAYVMNLGATLNAELRGTGIHSTVVLPGPTKTPAFTNRTDIDMKTMPLPPMSTKPVVQAALKGLYNNQPIVIPGWSNKVMDWLGRRVMTRGMNTGMWGMLMNRAAPSHLKVSRR